MDCCDEQNGTLQWDVEVGNVEQINFGFSDNFWKFDLFAQRIMAD